MKKGFISLTLILFTIFFLKSLDAQESKSHSTEINWGARAELILEIEADSIISDEIKFVESSYSFDTVEYRILTFNKTFFENNFIKIYVTTQQQS